MYKIKANPSIMHVNAQKVRTIKSSYESNMKELIDIVCNIDEIWDGEAQKEFVEKFGKLRGTFIKFSEILDKYAGEIDFAAREIKSVDDGLGRKFDNV